MTQKSQALKLELTFAQFGVELLPLKGVHHNPQVLCMLLFILRINQDIIYEYYYKFIQEWREYLIHQVHENCWGIGHSKWHN